MLKDLLSMDLQYFAENEKPDGGEPKPADNAGAEDKKPDETKSFTEEQLQKIVQERLDRFAKKAEKEKEDAIRTARERAEELASMTAEQREKERLEELEKELNEYKSREKKAEIRDEARKILASKGHTLSEDKLELLVRDNIEDTEKSINAFAELLDEQLQAKLKESARQDNPLSFKNQNGKADDNYGERLARKFASNIPKGE